MTINNESASKRLLTKELVAILFVSSVALFSGEILNPVLPLYYSDLGISAGTIGWMTAAMMIGIALSEIFWGWVIDRVDLKFAIFFGTVLLGSSIGLLVFARSITALVVVLFLYGFCRSPIYVIGRWYMSVYSPPHMRAFAMALLATVIGLVGAAGGFSSGYLAELKGFQFSFKLSAGLAISAGVLILVLGRFLNFNKHKLDQKHSHTTSSVPHEPQVVSQNAKLITLALGGIGVLVFICWGISMTYLPLYANKIGVPTSQIGIMYGIRGILSTLIMMPLGKLCDRYDKWIILSIGLGIQALAMSLVALSGNFSLLVLAIGLSAIGSAAYTPTITALLSQSIPVFWTGTAYGIFGFLEDIGWMIGPIVGGILWESVSPQMTFYFASLIVLSAIPLIAVTRKKFGNGVTAEMRPEIGLEAAQ